LLEVGMGSAAGGTISDTRNSDEKEPVMHEPHQDAQTTQLMASIRRLRAALVPGMAPNAVLAEIRKILDSDGMTNLLAHTKGGYFLDVLRQAKERVARTGSGSDLLDDLGSLLNSTELEAALATDDPNEQPDRLRRLMLEGPYQDRSEHEPAPARTEGRKL
jgi:hypothetical protein